MSKSLKDIQTDSKIDEIAKHVEAVAGHVSQINEINDSLDLEDEYTQKRLKELEQQYDMIVLNLFVEQEDEVNYNLAENNYNIIPCFYPNHPCAPWCGTEVTAAGTMDVDYTQEWL